MIRPVIYSVNFCIPFPVIPQQSCLKTMQSHLDNEVSLTALLLVRDLCFQERSLWSRLRPTKLDGQGTWDWVWHKWTPQDGLLFQPTLSLTLKRLLQAGLGSSPSITRWTTLIPVETDIEGTQMICHLHQTMKPVVHPLMTQSFPRKKSNSCIF